MTSPFPGPKDWDERGEGRGNSRGLNMDGTQCWKLNWDETRRNFVDWWGHRGLVLGQWGAPPAAVPHARLSAPPSLTPVAAYTDVALRVRLNEYDLSRCDYPADCLPLASADMGPGSLSLYLGSEPEFMPDTVWFHPSMPLVADPETLPPLRFDSGNQWWRLTEATLRAQVANAAGRYFASCPDLAENLDILASLRGSQALMMDMIERPEWVRRKLAEINQAFFEAYQRIYDIISLPGGGSCYNAFRLWGPGKTAKVECDAAAMISPDMFAEFVVPPLAEQCAWLDNSMFHLDGTQCLDKLDLLLEIEALDAIEWTPQAGIEPGGSPRWYPLYRRILEAGKSVQAVGVEPAEVIPLLNAIGGKGVYIITGFQNCAHAEEVLSAVRKYREGTD